MVTNDGQLAIDRPDMLGLFELQQNEYHGHPVWKKNLSIRFLYRRRSDNGPFPNSWCISPHNTGGNAVVISEDKNVDSILEFIGSSLKWNYFFSGARYGDTSLTLTEVSNGKFEILRPRKWILI